MKKLFAVNIFKEYTATGLEADEVRAVVDETIGDTLAEADAAGFNAEDEEFFRSAPGTFE